LKVPGSFHETAQKQQLVIKSATGQIERRPAAWKCGKLDVETSVGGLEKTDDGRSGRSRRITGRESG
jgi:hypothetical protein